MTNRALALPPERTVRFAAYAVLYLGWGSTYLAMRIALQTMPPFVVAGARFLVAALILFAVLHLRGSPWPTRRQWGVAALSSLFLLVLGNAGVLWGLKMVPSGVAALFVSTVPLWLAVLSRSINGRAAAGLGLGLCGVAVLAGPTPLAGADRFNPVGVVILLLSSVSWAAGSLLQRRSTAPAGTASAAQMLCGGVMLCALAFATGEARDVHVLTGASRASWMALAYLTILGSLVGMTAYTWLMAREEPARVGTYAYVNPVVAVLLGRLLADEAFTPRTAVAGALILAGVVVIVSTARRPLNRAA